MNRPNFARSFFGPEGTDMTSEEAAEWNSIPTEVLCDSEEHSIPANGQPCPHCHHGCSMPGDPECKGRE